LQIWQVDWAELQAEVLSGILSDKVGAASKNHIEPITSQARNKHRP